MIFDYTFPCFCGKWRSGWHLPDFLGASETSTGNSEGNMTTKAGAFRLPQFVQTVFSIIPT